jgi:hypothetical protein
MNWLRGFGALIVSAERDETDEKSGKSGRAVA